MQNFQKFKTLDQNRETFVCNKHTLNRNDQKVELRGRLCCFNNNLAIHLSRRNNRTIEGNRGMGKTSRHEINKREKNGRDQITQNEYKNTYYSCIFSFLSSFCFFLLSLFFIFFSYLVFLSSSILLLSFFLPFCLVLFCALAFHFF